MTRHLFSQTLMNIGLYKLTSVYEVVVTGPRQNLFVDKKAQEPFIFASSLVKYVKMDAQCRESAKTIENLSGSMRDGVRESKQRTPKIKKQVRTTSTN